MTTTAAERSLHTIIDQNADGIVIVDGDGLVRFANRAAAAFFDISMDMLIDHPFGYPMVGGERAELDIYARNAGHRIAEMRVVPIEWDGHGAYLASLRDITEQKRKDEVLRAKEEQLRHAQKLEIVGQLGAEVAHEVNNLLQGVLGCVRVALGKLEPTSPARPFIEEIERTAQRGTSVTRQLLGFTHLREPKSARLDLNEVVAGLAMLLRRLCGGRVEVTHTLEPALAPVRGDAGQIEQVLINLAVNARDAMPAGGTLTIRTHDELVPEPGSPWLPPGRYAAITVRDTGEGIDEQLRGRILEPFFTTKAKDEGTGLGLSTSATIVRDHGGHLAFESEVGKGTVFTVYFPVMEGHEQMSAPARGDGADHEPGTSPPPATAAETAPRATATILVVDDNDVARRALEELLGDQGYRILSAPDGQEGMRLLREQPDDIDLLLTDISLPDLDGDRLATQAIAIAPRLEVIYMSGHAPKAVSMQPGHVFLPKPVDFDLLIDTIEQKTRRPG